jgi:hypothetical protein
MAKTTHVFFNSEKTLPEVAEELGKLLLVQFHYIESEFPRWQADTCMMRLALHDDHGFDDDHEIPFEHFRYWLTLDCLYHNDGYPYNEQMRQVTARLVYELITARLGYSAMLVEDLQKLIAINKKPAPMN